MTDREQESSKTALALRLCEPEVCDGAKAREVTPAQVLSLHGVQAPGSVWGPRGGVPDPAGSPAVGAVSGTAEWRRGGSSRTCAPTSWVGPGFMTAAMLDDCVSPSC